MRNRCELGATFLAIVTFLAAENTSAVAATSPAETASAAAAAPARVLSVRERKSTRSAGDRAVRTARANASKKRSNRARKTRQARLTKRSQRRYRSRGRSSGNFRGHGVDPERLRKRPVPRPSGKVELYLVNFRETVVVNNIYNDKGDLDDAALAQLDHAFRCRRSKKERAVDPRLYETLSTIYDHFGQRPVHLVSGFRHQKNESSRHFHASAMDIRIPGVSIRRLYNFARSLDMGGMGVGIYPRSQFIHVDYRAPGAPSYRWTDTSAPGTGSGKSKRRNRRNRNNT